MTISYSAKSPLGRTFAMLKRQPLFGALALLMLVLNCSACTQRYNLDRVLAILFSLFVCGLILWATQPWLPITEYDIQPTLEVHYGNRNPRLRGFWDRNADCRV